jgi:hypothetical protein
MVVCYKEREKKQHRLLSGVANGLKRGLTRSWHRSPVAGKVEGKKLMTLQPVMLAQADSQSSTFTVPGKDALPMSPT